MLKKQNIVGLLSKIFRSDKTRLTAAALRIILLSITKMQNHREVILEHVLSNDVTDEIAETLLSSKDKDVVNASVDLLTFVARHLVCSTSTFRESADTRNWLSTRLLAGGTECLRVSFHNTHMNTSQYPNYISIPTPTNYSKHPTLKAQVQFQMITIKSRS